MGTGMAVFLIILFVLAVVLLIPLRVKASFGDGKWEVTVSYLFFRIFRKSSEKEPPPAAEESPPEPDAEEQAPEESPVTESAAESDAPPDAETSEPPPETPPAPQSDAAAAENTLTEEPEVSLAEEPEPAPKKRREKRKASHADEPETDTSAPAADKKPAKKQKRGFFKRIKPQSISEWIGLGKDALAALSPAMKFLTRHFHFRHLKIYLAVGSDDPAHTATLYGKLCAAAYSLLGALQCWVDIQTDEFRILADFYNESVTFRGALELRVSPAALILTVLILGVKFLWRTWCRFRREDREEKRYAEETKPLSDAA